jgi:hypothetical protein
VYPKVFSFVDIFALALPITTLIASLPQPHKVLFKLAFEGGLYRSLPQSLSRSQNLLMASAKV